MAYCLNPECDRPLNPDGTSYCQSCGVAIIHLLRSHYKIVKRLGRGGFGTTYLAEDVDKLDQSCVVKQLTPSVQGTYANKKALELFEQEARQLQELGEENSQIPSLYGYFEEQGYFYLVQQYIRGEDLLKELEQREVWTGEEIKQLLLFLLPVLQFVHSRGVVHRDLKPENIMRRQLKNGGSRLVLIDFGVSKQLSQTVIATSMGTQIGSPGYAPLEQMQGGEASAAGDLYSLGATCFHLLTKNHPYFLTLEHGYGWTSRWQEYVKSPLEDGLAAVVDKLLQKKVEQRYQSAEAVIQDLTPKPAAPQVLPPTIPSPPVVKPTQKVKPSQPQPVSIPTAKAATEVSPQPVAEKLAASTPVKPKKKFKLSIRPTKKQLRIFAGCLFGSLFVTGINWNSIFTSMVVGIDPKITLTGHSSRVFSVAFSSDGSKLASSGLDQKIKLWNVATGSEIATLSVDDSSDIRYSHHYAESVALSPDGSTVVAGYYDAIRLWDVATGSEIATFSGDLGKVNSVAFSPDGRTLASASYDGAIKLWDVATGSEIATFSEIDNFPIRITSFSVAFSPDSRTLASGYYDGTIRLWDVATGSEIATLTSHSDTVDSVAFSPDGRTLASGSHDGTIKLWDVATDSEIATFSGHSDYVYSVAFSPNGRTLASGSRDDTIKLWDVATGTEIATLTDHSILINLVYPKGFDSVAFSPDGRTLAGSNTKVIRLWSIPDR